MGEPVPLVRVQALEVGFPVRRRMSDLLHRRPAVMVRAVDGVDLSIARGEILGLVGESGSGKTTVGRVISKLTRPSAGTLHLDGTDITTWWSRSALAPVRRRIQPVFQDPYETISPRQRVRDFVAEGLVVEGRLDRVQREAAVIAALEAVGLDPAREIAQRYPHELSGGQRQRVVIAGALVLEPELIVADEPVSMLDVSVRVQILELLMNLRRTRGLAFLFITHDLSLAWAVADRIAVLYLGRVVESGPADAVIGAPSHPYTRALVSVVPDLTPREPGDATEGRTVLHGEVPDGSRIPPGCAFHPRCPVVMERCRTDRPDLVSRPGDRRVACWRA